MSSDQASMTAPETLEIATDADMVSLVIKGLGLVEIRKTKGGKDLYVSVEVFGSGIVEYLGSDESSLNTTLSHDLSLGLPSTIASMSSSDSLMRDLSMGTQLCFDDEVTQDDAAVVASPMETIYMTTDDETDYEPSPPMTLLKRRDRRHSSRFPGVTWKKTNHKWMAQITWEGEHLNLGYFDSENEAAFMYGCFALARNPHEYYEEWNHIEF